MRYLVVEGGDSPSPIWRPCEELADALATAEAALNSGAEDVRVLETSLLPLDVERFHVVRLASTIDPMTEPVLAPVPDLPEPAFVAPQPEAVEHQPDAIEHKPVPTEERDCPAAAWIDPATAAVEAATVANSAEAENEPVEAEPVADRADDSVRPFAAASSGPRIGSFGR